MTGKKVAIGFGGSVMVFIILFQILSTFNVAFNMPALLYTVKWLAVIVGVILVIDYASNNPRKGLAIIVLVSVVFIVGLPELIRNTVDFVQGLL